MWAFTAILVLSLGYWSQVYKNKKTKDVGNLSVMYFLCMAVGYIILSAQAVREGSFIFFLKQVSVLIPTIVIIRQILKYSGEKRPTCKCKHSVHPDDNFCGRCGSSLKLQR